MSTATRHATRPAAPSDAWMPYGLCRQVDPNLFFPDGRGAAVRIQTEQAKQVCGRCPVRERCLDWAVDTGQVSGVWGGLSEDERRELMVLKGDAAWAVCLDRQEFIEERRAQGATVRGIAQEIGVTYELFRKVMTYFEFERSTLAVVGGEGQ